MPNYLENDINVFELEGEIAVGGGGTTNYEDLNNLPQINGVELKGNKTTEELGINIPTKTSDLNNDSGYVNSSIVANPYDETSTYAVGAYVTHENNLYKCNTAITTAEEWNAEHWTLVDVISAIPTKTSQMQNDSNFASIDDTSTANDKAWSAEKISGEIFSALPTKSVIGSPVSFDTDLALPLESLKIDIVATQEAGTPTPSTPKQISGVSQIVTTLADGDMTVIEQITINLGDTYYGGYVTQDKDGHRQLVVTYKQIDLGSLNWTYNSNNSRFDASGITDSKTWATNTVASALCSIYKTVTFNSLYGGTDKTFAFDSRSPRIRDSAYNNATTFKTAVTGQKLVYELATPVIIDLPDGENITTIVGTNNLSNDTNNNMIVKYKESVNKELSVIPLLPWWSRFQNEFLRIAYSDIYYDKINTATHWLFASDMGFNVLKGDVEITSDGELIMCHDPGFTFDANGRIIAYNSNNSTLIKNMTYAECRSKVYADSPQRYGQYCSVADVDDFIKICKDKGKICFLTIRATNTASVVAKVVEKLNYYGMESRTILNATTSAIVDTIRANPDTKEIAVNFVATQGQAITTEQVDKCVNWEKTFLSIWADTSTTVIDNSATAIAYARQKNVPLLAAVSGDMSFWNYLIKKGIMGYQISKPIFDVEPKSYRFAVKMSGGSPTFENLFASNRFTGTATLSGTKIYVKDIYITGSYLTDVIDGIMPLKMNVLNPEIRCFDNSGTVIPCVWDSTNNRFELSLNDTNANTYTVLVTV